jgi:hypothetical protein
LVAGTEFLHGVKIRRQFAWRVIGTALLSAVICVFSLEAAKSEGAHDLSAFTISAPRTSSPPPIDGSIDHPAWRAAAHVALDWNVDFRRPASDKTDAYALVDASYLYLAFVAHQSVPVLATQRTTGKAVDSDDWVAAFVWPGGVNGFQYMFKCNALGVCYQTSSENADFAPIWRAAGRITADGFIVTMRLPLDVMRGDGQDRWRIQLARQNNRIGNGTLVWAYAPDMDAEDQAVYAGYLDGMHGLGAPVRPRPRLGIYGLGAIGSSRSGGNTSRVGADFAIPVSRSGSVVGTIHPDYSNVELDQQTIAPTEFRREFLEVRPFFTQGASFYNKFDAIADPGNIMLYTPGVATPSDGLAFEGTQGNFGLAAYEATSPLRTDAAQAASWSSADNVYSATLQRVTLNAPGLVDRATAGYVRVDNQRNLFAYADLGTDAGTNVLDPSRAQWSEFGAASHGRAYFIGAALRKIGEFYDPLDGFVAHPDIAGWAGSGEQDVLPPAGPILSVSLVSSIDRYHNARGALDQSDQNVGIGVQTRSQYSFFASSGSDFLLLPDGQGAMFDQNGVTIGYRDQSTTPTSFSYNAGRFGDGYLRSWSRTVSFQAGAKGSVMLEADDTALAADDGTTPKQWLERAAFSYQIGPQTSLAIGVRRIIGAEQQNQFVDASNVSAALHDRIGADDLYLVYGDANALATPPRLLLKWVHYFGAEKGT